MSGSIQQLADRIEDALGTIAGCGDIRFSAEIDEARTDARKALADLQAEVERLTTESETQTLPLEAGGAAR